MICKNCGEEIPNGMSICQNCGTPKEETAPVEATPVVENESITPEVSNEEIVPINEPVATPVEIGVVNENNVFGESPALEAVASPILPSGDDLTINSSAVVAEPTTNFGELPEVVPINVGEIPEVLPTEVLPSEPFMESPTVEPIATPMIEEPSIVAQSDPIELMPTPIEPTPQDAPVEPTPPVEPIINMPQPLPFEEPKKSKKGGINNVVIYIIILLIGIAAGVGVTYYLYGNVKCDEQEKCPECKDNTQTLTSQQVKINGYTFSLSSDYNYELTANSILISNNDFTAEIILTDKDYDTLKGNVGTLSAYFSANGYISSDGLVKNVNEVEIISIQSIKESTNYLFGFSKGSNNDTYGIVVTGNTTAVSDAVWEDISSILKSATYDNNTIKPIEKPLSDTKIITNINL